MIRYAAWIIWALITLTLAGYYGNKLLGDGDKSAFLIGDTSHGHFQIEMACETCHSSAFGGPEILQDACTQCHAEELEQAHDSHPQKKFSDPRNADLLAILDARYCISCHTEHQQEKTRAMGVTMPDDYCFHCHEALGDDRPSHKDLAFNSCASSGCHNYHDNRALYEDFLVKHASDPHHLPSDHPNRNILASQSISTLIEQSEALEPNQADAPVSYKQEPILSDWHQDVHSQSGVNCSSCHLEANNWVEKPSFSVCESCHKMEVKGFLSGKHGMSLTREIKASIKPMTPAQSELSFSIEANNRQHNCTACHNSHSFDTDYAKTDACLQCHNDEHSLAFKSSPHAQHEVSCASCHLPKSNTEIEGKTVHFVQHNQNNNLRPNEKMLRSACLHCHGLEFAIDSLADSDLIKTNFSGAPSKHIPSIDWALKRIKK